MNVFIIGGTGLIGLETAKKLIDLGHKVKTLALPPLPSEVDIPKELEVVFGNYLEISDDELFKLMEGCDGFIFAAGIDERIEAEPPIFDLFNKYNVDPLKRMLTLAKKANIKDVVVLGSYFTYFNRTRPDLNLTLHPYIKSRELQRELALSFADDEFNVAVVELPYIFGVQKGRKPVWVFLAEIIKKMKPWTFYSKGGTTMITVGQAADAVVGALLKNIGGNSYPIGYYNMSYKNLISIAHQGMGYSKRRKVLTVPNFIFKLALIKMDKNKKKKGLEGGLILSKFTKLQTSNLYIDKDEASVFLGVKEDDIVEAIKESFKLSMEIINNKEKDIIEMKS